MNPKTVWAVTDGRRGMENQALGLAEALAPEPVLKRVTLRAPFSHFPEWGLLAAVRAGANPFALRSDDLSPPWPDVLVACGRAGLAASLFVRKESNGATFTVQTQDPRIPARFFDCVVPPFHDRLTGANVIPILGAPGRITPPRLETAKGEWAERLSAIPAPRVAALIGGTSKAHRLTPERAHEIAEQLAALAARENVGLLVTTSRRTGADATAAIRRALTPLTLAGKAILWTDETDGENPYLGFLAHADHILVTEDSANMLTEAATTGKPVHLLALEGGTAKFARLQETLQLRGIVRPFEGRLPRWQYEPLRETERAGAEIRKRLKARQPRPSQATR